MQKFFLIFLFPLTIYAEENLTKFLDNTQIAKQKAIQVYQNRDFFRESAFYSADASEETRKKMEMAFNELKKGFNNEIDNSRTGLRECYKSCIDTAPDKNQIKFDSELYIVQSGAKQIVNDCQIMCKEMTYRISAFQDAYARALNEMSSKQNESSNCDGQVITNSRTLIKERETKQDEMYNLKGGKIIPIESHSDTRQK